MLNTCKKYLDEKHFCPHCKEQLSCCSTPPIHVGDGLGWGTEAYFICLNDECSLFKNGWEHIEMQFGHRASYRYMLLPGYAREKEALAKLDTCVAEKNL